MVFLSGELFGENPGRNLTISLFTPQGVFNGRLSSGQSVSRFSPRSITFIFSSSHGTQYAKREVIQSLRFEALS